MSQSELVAECLDAHLEPGRAAETRAYQLGCGRMAPSEVKNHLVLDAHAAERLFYVCLGGMKLSGVIWLREVVDKLLSKHNLTTDEVEEVLSRNPRFRFLEKGNVEGEHVYAAMGQTDAGRYVIAFFVYKQSGHALVISAPRK